MKKQAKLEALRNCYAYRGLVLTCTEVDSLQRIARQYQTLAEKYCNGDIESDEYDKRQAKLWDKLKTLLATQVSVRDVHVQNDPRGYCLKIVVRGVEIAPDYFN